MEFFDSTGISNEEAETLDIIKHESYGVEFLLNYNIDRFNTDQTKVPNQHSYLLNGDIHSPPPSVSLTTPSSQNSTLSPTATTIATTTSATPLAITNQTNHYQHQQHHQNYSQHQQPHHNNNSLDNSHHIHHHHHNNYHQQHHHHNTNNHHHTHHPQQTRFINHHANHNNEWETTSSQRTSGTTSSSNHHDQPNSSVLVANIAAQSAAHGHPPHPYIFGAAPPAYYHPPPNHPYTIHALPLGAATVHPNAAAASVNQHQRMPIQNIVVHSSSNNNKNSKSPSNPSICDIRNSYVTSPQYSDASRPMIDATQHPRLKNASVAGDQSGGNINDQAIISNGSSTATVTLPAHHLSPYANPFAFQHALTYPPFTHPFYYVTPESYLQYPPSMQPPQTTHISSIPPAAHLINTSSSITTNNIPLTSSNQPPVIPAPYSSAAISTASSSMSASSVSSTSTASHQNTNIGHESSTVPENPTNVSSSNNQEHQSPTNMKNHLPDDKISTIEQNVPSQSADQDKNFQNEANDSDVPQAEPTTEATDVKQASDYLKLYLNISDPSSKDDATKSNEHDCENTNSTNDDVQVDNTNTSESTIINGSPITNDRQTDKPTTWASRLFPTSVATGMNNIDNQISCSINNNNNKNNEESKSLVMSDNNSASNVNETKLHNSQSNGDFPELNVIAKSHHNRRYGGRSSTIVDDYKNITVVPMKADPIAFRLAKRLRDNIHLKHSLPTIMPRGLINRGNWCYVNATLQALLACPPFYNLMREISETSGLFRQSTSTPIIDNFARYFVKFLPTDYKRQMKTVGNSYLEELLNNDPFEPIFIYDTLKHCGMIKNDAQRGHQEDAEEFLSSVLNGLNEEMISLSKFLEEETSEKKAEKTNGYDDHKSSNQMIDDQFGINQYADDNEDDAGHNSSDDMWHEVGTTKHKSLPTRSAKTFTTSITEIFGGTTLDVRTVNQSSSGNRQPFFTLQLDIKPAAIKSLEDAIRWQTKSEIIHGYTCSKTKQIVDANSQMFLENLPPILILHLKLFDYEIETGASKKLLKTIDFSENFEIPRECVSGKVDNRCRRYKLLAVVYHNGTEVINGHYITDVYHLGLNQWLRCDDSTIKVISLSKVLTGNEREGNLVPYLLFYRRYDTLHSNNSSSSSSSTLSTMMANNNVNSNNGNSSSQQLNNSKRSINNNDFYHNHYHHHNNNNYHNDNNNSRNQDLMLANNKFSSISRQQY